MQRFMTFIMGAILVVGLSGHANADQHRLITMNGSASIEVKPDIIRITAGVIVQQSEAADAFRIMSEQLNQVADVLSRQGIAPVDIQTSDLSLGERYGRNPVDPNGNQIVVGYTASSALTVVVRDLDGAGDIVETLVTQGANQIRGFAFDISDPTEALEQARLAAIRDAIEKTDLYAQAANVKVGDILTIVETAGHVNRPQALSATADFARSVPIAGGSLSVSAGVNIVTALK